MGKSAGGCPNWPFSHSAYRGPYGCFWEDVDDYRNCVYYKTGGTQAEQVAPGYQNFQRPPGWNCFITAV
jgi:hypothetical protein